jgi:U3 small nucleolar RNA-associated protein 20
MTRLFYLRFRKLHDADKVKAVITRLLAQSETATQKLALECLAGWNQAHVTAYKEHLLRIIDEKTWREEITLFTLDSGT